MKYIAVFVSNKTSALKRMKGKCQWKFSVSIY
jgi:hypothetical protein